MTVATERKINCILILIITKYNYDSFTVNNAIIDKQNFHRTSLMKKKNILEKLVHTNLKNLKIAAKIIKYKLQNPSIFEVKKNV